jgi:plastocyanin
MQRFLRPALGLVLTLALGACGSGSTTSPAASTGAAATSAPSTGAAATSAESAAPPAGGGASSAAACAPGAAGAAPTVNATIKDFTFAPEPITAKVGDVIGWTNSDPAGHTASLDDGTCTTDIIATGATGTLVFSAPGTYAYHCNIHPTRMTGTITIT